MKFGADEMFFNLRLAAISVLGVSLAACITTQEMPLAPNMVRLDTRASGALYVNQAVPQTMKRAAELTLQNGYEYFRLDGAQMGQGSELGGVYTSGSANGSATVYGNQVYANGSSNSFSTPIYRRTSEVGVTVIMFHANEPESKNAFNAEDILKKYAEPK